jgi:YVTN family beta-propeller protein
MQVNKEKIKENPFVGPRPFGRNPEDQLLFFGRTYETEEILTLILSHQLILIYAQSGTGKTSILNANVIPELEKEGFKVLPTARVGISPYDIDETNIAKGSKKDLVVSNHYMFNALWSMRPDIDPRSLANMSLSDFLNKYFSTNEDSGNFPFSKLIIFDQLEEIFNIFPKNWYEEQIIFFKQIADAMNKYPHLRIVFVIREDYLAQLDPFSRILPEKLRPRFRLERLRKSAALQAIKGPLDRAKSHSNERSINKLFEEGIIDQLIEELLKIRVEKFGGKSEEIKGEFIEPIQLQVVCQRLWNKLKSIELVQINKDYFVGLGDVDKALADFYDDAIREASKISKINEGTVRYWVEEKLITSSDTRSSIHRESKSTGGISNTVVDILEKRYIIRKEERAGAKWYELTHDRFIKPIKDSNNLWKKHTSNILRMKFYNNKKKIISSTLTIFILTSLFGILYGSTSEVESCSLDKSQTINVGNSALGIDFNPITNKAYVANQQDNIISVIDCNVPKYYNIFNQYFDIFDTSIQVENKPIPLNKSPFDVAVNPTTNKIYVIHQFPPSLSIIDGNNNNILNQSIPLGRSPVDIAINTNSNKIYIANSGSSSVSVIDGETDKWINDLDVFGTPISVAVNPNTNKMYVANEKSNSILIIDETNYKGNYLQIFIPSSTADLNINPITNKVYASHALNNTVSIIDGISDRKIDEIDVGKKPIRIDIDKETNQVFVVNQGSDSVSVIDGIQDTLLKTLKIPSDQPYDVEFNSNINSVYVTNVGDSSGTVNIIKYDNDNYLNYIHVGKRPVDIDVNPETNKTYVVNSDSDTLSIINSTNRVEKQIAIGDNPVSVAVNPTTNKIYVSHQSPSSSPSLSVIDEKNNYQLLGKSITVGRDPLDIDINPITNKVYVANNGDNTISVIDGNTDQVKNISIPVGKNPIKISVDPNTNKVYVANYGDSTISVIDGNTDKVKKMIGDGIDGNPYSIAINTNTSLVYVGYSNLFHYSLIDGKNDKVLVDSNNESVKIAVTYACPSDIAMNQEKNVAYVSFDCKDGISIINGTSYESKPTKVITLGENNINIAFNAGTNQIYVADSDSNILYVKDINELL